MRRSGAPSGRVAYVDGRYLRHGSACVHIEDRGLQFADSVYEVCAVVDGRMLDEEAHLDRLERSLKALDMHPPMARGPLKVAMREMLRRNRLRYGLLYMQVTRGAFRRDHPIPNGGEPTLIMTARNLDPAAIEKRRGQGVAVVTLPDLRWGRCDIKTTGLLANVLAKTAARKAGAFEAWLVDKDGFITEGSSTNAWIVTQEGDLVTRDLAANILAGVTRATIIGGLAGARLSVHERAFSVAEAQSAREAFFTSATGNVIPVVSIDGRIIGNGQPGSVTRRVYELYRELSGHEP